MISVSTDKSKLDIKMVHSFLTQSYWAFGVSLINISKRIENAMCFGIYRNNNQIGFARVITDQISFAYIADLFICEDERGHGFSKLLMNAICFHESLTDVGNWYLVTKDAQALYKKSGFAQFNMPSREVMYCSKEHLIKIDI